MATWVNIPNSSLASGAPARSIDAIALRDNVTAIAQGATGAPRIESIALNNGIVTNAKIANYSVNALKIASDAVDSRCMKSPAAGTAQIVAMLGEGAIGTSSTAYQPAVNNSDGSSVGGVVLVPGVITAYFQLTSPNNGNECRILKNGAVVAAWTINVTGWTARQVNISVNVGDSIIFQQRGGGFSPLITWRFLRIYSATKNMAVA